MRSESMAVAHAAHSDWRVAADACLERLAIPSGANLGFVYASDAFSGQFADIAEHLRARTGVAHWVGSVGIGVCATGVEYFDEPALCVLTARFPEESFRVFAAAGEGLAAFEAAHGEWCEAHGARFAMVHGDPHNGAIDALVDALCARMPGGFVVGGLTSSRAAHPQLADGVTEGDLSGVLFDPSIGVVTRLTQGCTPLGPRRRITRARGNVILELDGRAALDAFGEDVGESRAADPSALAGRLFAGLPVKGSDTGDYLVRNLVGIDPHSRALAIGAWIEEGDQVMFCLRDAAAAAADMGRMLAELRAALDAPPRGGIYFTCLARGPNLLGADSAELRLIEDALGRFPLVGFFGNGEISHHRLYAYTGVLTLFV